MQKKSTVNRLLQNLTAHYNLLFNANELLKQKQLDYASTFADAYDRVLNVYPDTIDKQGADDKDIEAAIFKANAIINEKEQSRYIADAYMVIGKANYLSGNFFNAVEFFNYVTRSFPKRTDLVQEALVWKARALLYLNNTNEARITLDTALKNLAPKKRNPADVYATRLQYDINIQNYTEAEDMALRAVNTTHQKWQKLRWTFILAQLQEINQKNNDAIKSYSTIVSSNAPFEMAFNAGLSRIRIQESRNGVKLDRIALLLKLLKNDNNVDFRDQIYYQVGEVYRNDNDMANAIKYYNLSLHYSTINQNQKGLSYLRIADINFKDLADYVSAKKYYDSVLLNLPVQYPGYRLIKIKTNNLQLLVDKLKIIAFEDTVQMLAKLDEAARAKRIDRLVDNEILRSQTPAVNASPTGIFTTPTVVSTQNTTNTPGSGFYFYNAAAIGKGFNDFKVKWGNRQLADNWRLSQRSAADAAAAVNPAGVTPIDPDASLPNQAKNDVTASAAGYRQSLLKSIPLTAQQLQVSNQNIYDAYVDIANFYRDILGDKNEAIANYLSALKKGAGNVNNASIYYNLYRLYSEIDKRRSDEYKNKLLAEFPETVFAKVILDPGYASRTNDKDALFNAAYNNLFTLYQHKQYTQVKTTADSLIQIFAGNRLLPQVQYLRAVAVGHLDRLGPFEAGLQQIANNYPDDKLITPLVKQHMEYINAHQLDLLPLIVVLDNNDTTGVIFTPPIAYQKETPYNRERVAPVVVQTRVEPQVAIAAPSPVKQQPAVITAPAIKPPPVTTPVVQTPPVLVTPKDTAVKLVVTTVKPPVKVVSDIFSLRDSTNYYFVVNVNTGTTDLSSSRFGIGQFNRATLKLSSIAHRLKFAGPNNQLIYVGKFTSLAAVKDYARAILPVLPDIMKVSKDKYSFFVITQENLNKLADKKLLDSYIDYYQQTY